MRMSSGPVMAATLFALLVAVPMLSAQGNGSGGGGTNPGISSAAGEQGSGSPVAIKRPPIRFGKIFYDAQDRGGIPLSSMLQLFDLYTDEELSRVTEISLSANTFSSIEGLQRLPHLKILDLLGNRIERIEGLEVCPNLEVLNLSSNRIERISGLSSLANLRELLLANNRLARIDGLGDLRALELLDLSGNLIQAVGGLGGLTSLKWLWLSNNELMDYSGLLEISNIEQLSIASPRNVVDEDAVKILREWNRRHPKNTLKW